MPLCVPLDRVPDDDEATAPTAPIGIGLSTTTATTGIHGCRTTVTNTATTGSAPDCGVLATPTASTSEATPDAFT
jgi:hypothetical protein